MMRWELVALILLIMPQLSILSISHTPYLSKPLPLSMVNGDSPLNFYDEQLFMMLNTYPVSTNFTAYVYAIAQSSTSGYGPAYLINAVTNTDWWYQLGIAYNWPFSNGTFDPGFHMIYMVWASNGSPVRGPVLLNFNGVVQGGDEIMLEMYFLSGNMVLCAYDTVTHSKAIALVPANGSQIVTSLNLVNHGYFTGLMTEWYHLRPYYGSEEGVIYKLPSFSGYFSLGVNEFYNSSGNVNTLFYSISDFSPSNNYTFYNLTYGGAFETSNGIYYVTGSLYPILINYKIIGGNFNEKLPVTYYSNYQKITTYMPSLIFVNPGSNITVPTEIVNGLSRIYLINQTPIKALKVGNLTLYYQLQYYVGININVNATVNGVTTILSSGWYNSSSTISINPYTYYSNDSRIYIISVNPSKQFVLNSPVNLTVNYVLQYYVYVTSQFPLYGSINGTNTTIQSNWYNSGTIIKVFNITLYLNNETRIIYTRILPATYIIVNRSYTFYVQELIQYYLSLVSQIPVYALINGTNQSLKSNWFNTGTVIQVENITIYGPNNQYRYIITSISPSSTFVVDKPIALRIYVVKQFPVIVKSPIPVYALINGTNQSLSSFMWINNGTRLQILNVTHYVNNVTRLIIVKILPSSNITVITPLNISISTITQYYLELFSNYPVYVSSNGKNVTLQTNWYNNGTQFTIYRIWYINQLERQYLSVLLINGSKVLENIISVNEPIRLDVYYIIQYYIGLVSNIPIKAIVNTSLITFSSGWYNKGSSIVILNNTYYPTSDVRYVVLRISPQNFTVNEPINISVVTVEQFLVKINIPIVIYINNLSINTSELWVNNGQAIKIPQYINITSNERILYNTTQYVYNVTSPLNVEVSPIKEYLVTINGVSEWLPVGSEVTLTESLPIYLQGKWVGTENVSNGETITVSQPITETFIKNISSVFLGGIILVIAIIIAAILILILRRPKI
ncbi:hypothetical protein [Saccharolobus sp. A20]|uniref:hypothetical protein n=1 Tax=Saccharolobus sp. A20 TaxID=1891280 RepID=UPI000A75F8F7|nr:hypothetical protein [Sulfolobus sp. A20]